MKLPRAPLAKRRLMATVSSTGKPRVACEAKACTATMSPHSMRRLWTSWIMLSRMGPDRKSTRLNSSHSQISYAVFCLKKKKYNNGISPQPCRHEVPVASHVTHIDDEHA